MSPINIKQLDLNLEQLKKDSRRINNKVIKQLGDTSILTDKRYQAVLADQLSEAPLSSQLHDHYNVFSFPYDGIYELYREICTFFKETCPYSQPYYIHAWLNYGKKGDVIPWHNHWGGLANLDQTFVCSYYVNAEPSTTTYKWPDGNVYDMNNKNNTITLYEDVGDIHQANIWEQDEPRISISMDMVPMKYIQGSPFLMNTWIPII